MLALVLAFGVVLGGSTGLGYATAMPVLAAFAQAGAPPAIWDLPPLRMQTNSTDGVIG